MRSENRQVIAKIIYAEVANVPVLRDHGGSMGQLKRGRAPLEGQELISLAQKLARDAERHAILSASLASQADRLMVAGLRLLDPPRPPKAAPKPRAQA
jgi:hypothetical protein